MRAQSRIARATTVPMVGLGLAQTGTAVLQAWALAGLIAAALDGVAPELGTVAIFVLAAFGRIILGLLLDRRAFEAGAGARRRLRTGFLVAAFSAGPYRAGAGTDATTAVDQVDALDSYFGRWLPASVLAWASPLLVVGVVLSLDPSAALVLAVGGLLVPVGMAVAGIGAATASQRQFTAMARLQSRFLDRVRGIETIVLAGQAEAEAGRLQVAAIELAGRTMRVLRVAFLSSAMLDAAAAAVLVLLATRAGLTWRAGTLDVRVGLFTLVLVAEFFAPLRAFAAAYQDRLQAMTAAQTFGALPAPVEVAPPVVRSVAASGVTVAFEQVRFAWDAARGPVFDGLSFRVTPNETAVLVGPSGSGKSTVIELLLGFIKPQAGRITVNGVDLATLTPAALSRMTAWIGQRPVLFAGTIRDNIRFGQADASDFAVEEAAGAAGLRAVTGSLPNGLDTVVGEGGFGLSGGQAQRVAIARAFLRNAPLLLLDEPTAHLDPATEGDVLDSLRRLAIGRTVILAAHSSAAMAFGGRRIALEGGRAVAA